MLLLHLTLQIFNEIFQTDARWKMMHRFIQHNTYLKLNAHNFGIILDSFFLDVRRIIEPLYIREQ